MREQTASSITENPATLESRDGQNRDLESRPTRSRWGRWPFIGAWTAMGAVSAFVSVNLAVLIADKFAEFAQCRANSPCSPSTMMSATTSAMVSLACAYIVSGVASLLIGLAETQRPIRAAALTGVAVYLVGMLITLGMLVPAISAAHPH
ncbi:hypothetical protein [Nocardia miyunensis]|uniref:hypothetical protein n=1 Tax=Nocardia miyunensis TaxID=282684 RepID=UPI000833F3AC|nr:hypothetical protein [Nocardia miyunensis]